jgi:two-component system, chemotaxis family, chemotaxis protein CheY
MPARILIADDSTITRTLIKRALESDGMQVVGEAANGRELVDLYFQLKPDLMTVDYHMPQFSGGEAIAEILKKDPAAKVIVVTALQGPLREEILRAGARGVLGKPFRVETMVAMVHSVLNPAK